MSSAWGHLMASRRSLLSIETAWWDERIDVTRPASSGEELVHRDLADRLAIDHNRHLLAGPVVGTRGVSGRTRVGVDLDLAVDQVDDPVDRDPRRPRELGAVCPIVHQAGVGDLGNHRDIARAGMVTPVIPGRPPHDAMIGLRLADLDGKADGLVRAQMPAGRDEAAEFVSTEGIRDRVGGFRVIFSTRYPSIRWHRSRLVKTPEATIASYFSRDIR